MALTLVPDEQLHDIAEHVSPSEVEALWSQVVEMANLLNEKNGIGLAAPQVGINKRFFITKYPDNVIRVYFNPVLKSVKSFEKRAIVEGCLSYPDENYEVQRWMKCKFHYHEFNFDNQSFKMRDETVDHMKAVLIQHEMDHLDGVTITTKGRKLTQEDLEKKNIKQSLAL